MARKIDKDNIDQLTTVANELFENVEIKEEDFADQFEAHNSRKFKGELVSRKEDLLDYGSKCSRYEPCPICYKCRVKGSHIYAKCDECAIDLCIHQDKHINHFIVRDNFATPMPEEVANFVKDMEQKVFGAMGVPEELLNKKS